MQRWLAGLLAASLLCCFVVAEPAVGTSTPEIEFRWSDFDNQLDDWEADVKATFSDDVDSIDNLLDMGTDKDEEPDLGVELDDVAPRAAAPVDDGLEDLETLEEDDSDAQLEATQKAVASNFAPAASVESHLPVEDYLQERVEVDVPKYSHEEGKATYCLASKGEVRDAVVLSKSIYSPHKTVKSKVQPDGSCVQADIYLPSGMHAEDTNDLAMLNIDLKEEAGESWEWLKKHFSKFAGNIKDTAAKKWARVSDWAKKVKSAVANKVEKVEDWGSTMEHTVKGKWLQLKKRAKNLGGSVNNLFVCQLKDNKFKYTPADVQEAPVCRTRNAADTAYVIFRGGDQITDWIQNLQYKQKPCTLPGCKGKVHAGFKACYDSIRERLYDALEDVMTKKGVKRIVVAGHSLGGALALLHAKDSLQSLSNVQIALATFGQPRVGDAEFAKNADSVVPGYPRVYSAFNTASCSCRHKDKADFVTTVPRSYLEYTHAGNGVPVPCAEGSCRTRCCPQATINQIKCHDLDQYVSGVWKAF